MTRCSGNCNNTSDNWNQSLFSISVPQKPEYLAQKKGNPVNELEMWWHKNIKLPWNKTLRWENYCSFICHLKIIPCYIFSRVPAKGSTQDPVEVSQIFLFIPCLNSPLITTVITLIFLLPSWLAIHIVFCLLFTFYGVNLDEKQKKFFVLSVVFDCCVFDSSDFCPATYLIFILTIIVIKVSMVII